MVKNQLKDLVLIYPESWKNFNFVNETLALFPELEYEIIPSDVHLFVKTLVMPEVKPWTPMIIPEHIDEIRSLLICDNHIDKQIKVYISRDDAQFKKIHNHEAVNDLFRKKDYEIHTMSGKSLKEQVGLMQKAKNLISINGAGLANFMFLREQSNILEFSYKLYLTSRRYKFHFKKISDYLNCNYLVQFSDTYQDKGIQEIGLQNLIIDIKTLEKNLNLLDENK